MVGPVGRHARRSTRRRRARRAAAGPPPSTTRSRSASRCASPSGATSPSSTARASDGHAALWARVPDVLEMSAGTLAILGDYVPFGVGQALGELVTGSSLDNTLRVCSLVRDRMGARRRAGARGRARVRARAGAPVGRGRHPPRHRGAVVRRSRLAGRPPRLARRRPAVGGATNPGTMMRRLACPLVVLVAVGSLAVLGAGPAADAGAGTGPRPDPGAGGGRVAGRHAGGRGPAAPGPPRPRRPTRARALGQHHPRVLDLVGPHVRARGRGARRQPVRRRRVLAAVLDHRGAADEAGRGLRDGRRPRPLRRRRARRRGHPSR